MADAKINLVATDDASKVIAQVRSEMGRLQTSAAQTAAAMRQLPAQFSDIIVSLQGGQKPLTVLLQQGSQIKDSFGGVSNAAKGISSYITGMVNPMSLVAVGAGSIAYAFFKGRQEAQDFNKALAITGNAAGTTTGELANYAKNIAAITGTQGAASAALIEFASNSDVGNASLQNFTLSAIQFEKATGQAIGKTAEQFSSLSKAPLEASIKLNEQYNYLTASVYDQIKALTEQGKVTEAADIAQKAFADTISQRSTVILQDLGYIERAWGGIWGAIKGAGDAALNFGRGNTITAQIAELESKIKSLNEGSVTMGFKNPKLAQELSAELAALKATQAGNEANAQAAADATAQNKALFQWDTAGVKLLPEKLKMEREIAAARELGLAAGKSSAEIAAREKEIRASYSKKTGNGDATKAQLALDLENIKKASEAIQAEYANNENILQALRGVGLVDDEAYYASKQALIELNSETESKAYADQIARLRQETLTGKDKLENDKKIAELQGKLATSSAKATADLVILGIQEKGAVDARAASYLSARQAAQDYFETLERGYARELASVGKGKQAREYDAGLSQVEERFAQRRRDLENNRAQAELAGKFTPEAQQQYDQQLAILDEYQGKEKAAYTQQYAALRAAQGDWLNGATEALANYLDETHDVAGSVEKLLTGAFKGAEDSLVEFVKTGKLSFSSLADSIISDLARILIQKNITGPLASWASSGASAAASSISSLFSAKGNAFDSSGLVPFANGGVFDSPTAFSYGGGKMGVLGEAGPEAILPLTRGSDGTLGLAGGSGGVNVTVNVIEDANKGGTQQKRDDGNGGSIIDVFVVQVKKSIAADITRGSGDVPAAMANTYGLNRAVGAF